MAQTKRKRRSKHRGPPAGKIETRGRTGRPPTPTERKQQARVSAREKRLSTPPTWRSSITRAFLAAGLVFVFLLFTTKGKHKIPTAFELTVIALVIYIPAGYYLERFLFRRRQAKRAGQAGGGSRPR